MGKSFAGRHCKRLRTNECNWFHGPPSFPGYVETAPALPLPPYTPRLEEHCFHEFKGDGIKVTHFKSERKETERRSRGVSEEVGTQCRQWLLGQSPSFFRGLLVLQLAGSAASTASQSLLYPVLLWASVAFSSPHLPLAWWEQSKSVDSMEVHPGVHRKPRQPQTCWMEE